MAISQLLLVSSVDSGKFPGFIVSLPRKMVVITISGMKEVEPRQQLSLTSL